MATSPAIVIVSEFTYSDAKGSFSGYIDYMNRQDAKLNDRLKPEQVVEGVYAHYTDYMADGKKNGSLFDAQSDDLDAQQKKELVQSYHEAETLGSPLWKDVISFDNDWLEEQGLYDSKTHWLNEVKMKDVIRSAMDEMIQAEKMQMPVWSASFHYNTDNIHVHIATVELDPTHMEQVHAKDPITKQDRYDDNGEPVIQYRGMRKQGSLKKVKSKIVNKLIDRTPAYKRIDELIRDNARRVRTVDLREEREMKDLFKKAIELLPEDKKQWRYGYQSVDSARPYIDQIGELYLSRYYQDEMKELSTLLDDQVEISERLYGEAGEPEQYRINKEKDLKQRVGNAVLGQIRDYVKEQNTSRVDIKNKTSIKEGNYYYHFKPLNSATRDIKQGMYYLNKAIRKTVSDYEQEKNMEEFDRMIEGYEV